MGPQGSIFSISEKMLYCRTAKKRWKMKKSFMLILLLICLLNLACGRKVGEAERGKASYYSKDFEGRITFNGEIFSNRKLTAAHKTLPMGTVVRVTNLANGKSIDVRINDRGPFIEGRIIDLTERAFGKIGDKKLGTIDVSVQVLE